VRAGASVIGGGVLEVPGKSRIQTIVFAFNGDAKPSDALDALLTKAGYVRHDMPQRGGGGGGFVGIGPPAYSGPQYCNASSWAGFEVVDSTQTPLVVGVRLVDGEPGRQTCTALRASAGLVLPPRFGVKVPTLTPPRGALTYGGSSNWGSSRGTMESTLRTTMAADSILYHYTSQLVAGGWKAEGLPAITDGVAVQRFSFREGQDAWTAALIFLTAGDRREAVLELAKVE
jgi:hypothetical protein